jgi:PAS domain S-box-containing protein
MSNHAASSTSDILDELPLPYLEVDSRGVVVRANRATFELHSAEHGELLGQLAHDFLPSNERDQAFAAFVETMHTGQDPKPVLRSIFDKSGEFHTRQIYRSLIRDENGVPQGMRMISVDVTESERQLENERQSRAFLGSILQAVSEAMLVTDALGFIRFVNPASEALLGWKASELMGKTIEHAIPILSFSSAHDKRLDFTMALQGPRKGEATVLDRERHELRVEISTAPIIDKENGFTTGVVSVLRRIDTTA